MKYYQQGDILIKEATIPKNAKIMDRRIIAEGETTGHKHQLEDLEKAQLLQIDSLLFLDVLEETRIIHEEHNPVTLPPGTYEVGFVMEYDHFEEETKRIKD